MEVVIAGGTFGLVYTIVLGTPWLAAVVAAIRLELS